MSHLRSFHSLRSNSARAPSCLLYLNLFDSLSKRQGYVNTITYSPAICNKHHRSHIVANTVQNYDPPRIMIVIFNKTSTPNILRSSHAVRMLIASSAKKKTILHPIKRSNAGHVRCKRLCYISSSCCVLAAFHRLLVIFLLPNPLLL